MERALLPCRIAFVSVIGLAVPGSTPAPDAPAGEVVRFTAKRTEPGLASGSSRSAMPFLPSSRAASPDSSDRGARLTRGLAPRALAGAAIMSATLGVAITTQLALADSTEPG